MTKENDKIFNLSYEDIINLFKKYNKSISKELLEDLPFFLETLKKNHNVLLKLGENKSDRFEELIEGSSIIELVNNKEYFRIEKKDLKEMLSIYKSLRSQFDTNAKSQLREFNVLHNKIEKLEKEHIQLSEDLHCANSNLENENDLRVRLEKENKHLTARNEYFENRINNELNKEIEKLKQQTERDHYEIISMNETIKNLKKENESLKSELKNYEAYRDQDIDNHSYYEQV